MANFTLSVYIGLHKNKHFADEEAVMSNEMIFLPVLANILLVFGIYAYMGKAKSRAVKQGSVDKKVAALNSKAWPDNVVKISNNLDNQFESPILFYVLSIVYYLTNNVTDILILTMAAYVITRYLHSYVHMTSNYVPYRFKLFVLGLLILLGSSVWLAIKIITQ